jgi:hypothetical protein
MPDLSKFRRALWVIGTSVLLFLVCIAAAFPGDNSRLFQQLHAAHQSKKYWDAVAALNKEGKGHFNECTTCHTDTGPINTLVFERKKVADNACGLCHQPNQAVGRAFLSKEAGQARTGRPAHQGTYKHDKAEERAGAEKSADGKLSVKLRCADCHPDHLGKSYVEHVSAPVTDAGALDETDGKKMGEHVKMTELCVRCHLPEGNANVLKAMMKAHGAAFEKELKETATASEFMTVMRAQPKQYEQGCTPTCHAEHMPQFNDSKPK